MKKGDPEIFGRPASEWTDQDIRDALDYNIKCELKIDLREQACRVGAPGCGTEPSQATVNMAKGYERDLRDIVLTVRERLGVQLRQQAAQQAQEAALILRKEKMAEEAARRREKEMVDQTARDHAAAAEAASRAQIEEPRIAEAVKQAQDARNARDAAERRLAEIRSKIEAENTAAKKATEQAQSADNSRQQVLREQSESEADARLPNDCKVSLEQFQQVRFGMPLRQVNQLFGCQGRQMSGTRLSGLGTFATYAWDGNSGLSVVTATFKGNSLQSKAQMGLE